MSVHLDDSLLGKSVAGSSHYDPGLLFPIPRSQGRNAIGLSAVLPFHGVDIWNAWELSWLVELGKPQVAVAEIRVPADSPNLIESKSLKLYLNSLNAMRYPDAHHVERLLRDDLGDGAGCGPVGELAFVQVEGVGAGTQRPAQFHQPALRAPLRHPAQIGDGVGHAGTIPEARWRDETPCPAAPRALRSEPNGPKTHRWCARCF